MNTASTNPYEPYFGKSWAEVIHRRTDRAVEEHLSSVGRLLGYVGECDEVIYPAYDDIFKALKATSFEQTRVVIVGQDPYPNGQADGLAFSSSTRALPYSLGAILREISHDMGVATNAEEFCKAFTTWNLEEWAAQGVLLINSSLTVERNKPGSHEDLWRGFVHMLLQFLATKSEPLVWMAWGHKAINILPKIDETKHLLLTAGHPAAAAYGKDAFSGCKHFSQANEYLRSHGLTTIDWRLSPRREDLPWT